MSDENDSENTGISKHLISLNNAQNYVAPLVLIPLLIGGVWQLLALSSMGLSFIRFFSVSQMIPDGLIVVFLLSLIYITIKASYSSLDKPIKTMQTGGIIINIVQFVTMSPPLIWLIYVFLSSPDVYKSAIFWVITPFAIITSIYSLMALFYALNKTISKIITVKPVDKNNIVVNAATEIVLFYAVAGTLAAIIFISLQFHNIFSVGTNLSNVGNICNGTNETCEIIYFNDKYIFVKKDTSNTANIEVMQFDSFFKNSNN